MEIDKIITNIINLYSKLREILSEADYVSYIFQLITIIMTLITFLTVMMSVGYQESIYNARELVFEIKETEELNDICNNIRKLEYIEEEKRNYKKIVKMFLFSSIAIILISIILAPIYCINSFVKIIIISTIIFLIIVIYNLNKFFLKDTRKNFFEYVVNASNYLKNFSKEINIFPSIIIKNNDYLVIDSKIPLKNYSLAIQIERNISEFLTLVYKRDFDSVENNSAVPNIKLKNIDYTNINVEDISYFIKTDNSWKCFDVQLQINNNELEIVPKRVERNVTVFNSILELEEKAKSNCIITNWNC